MSRLYIIAFFACFWSSVFGQSDFKRYLEFAKEKYKSGDYIYAIDFYEKAMKLDSSSIDVLWDYAQALRAYKDYNKAEFYYAKVYEKEKGKTYPESLLYYGLMLKHNRKYDEATQIFKKGRTVYKNEPKGYLYQKVVNEISSCAWAKLNSGDSTNLIFEQLPETVNTSNAEFGHRVFNKKLLYSSLRADSSGMEEEVYDPNYTTHLYTSKIKDSSFSEGEELEDLFWEKYNTGNGTFSLDSNRFYFSNCKTDDYNYNCKIVVAYFENENFVDVDTLGFIINEPGFNTTMPFVGEWDGEEVLFFSSNRSGGKGGMDLWYSFIKNGNQFKQPQNISQLNSLDNDLTPFWDGATKTLYFSTSWYDGFGGYDIFKSQYSQNGFKTPINMMEPINSPANDLYFFKTSSGDTSYLSSNRLGSNYSKNPTCCSDVFLVREKFIPKPPKPEEPTIEESLENLNAKLPVTLYFHNDIPNPDSWDSTTNVNYINAYHDYIAMIDEYKQEFTEGLNDELAVKANENIENFFEEKVKQGVKDLEVFRDALLELLQRGRKIQITVRGFASPLAKTDYNVNLTKRRIASLVNYLYQYDNGVFQPYLDNTAENGARVTFTEVPFGEYQADQTTSDDPFDVKNSVYSTAAAIERKIEIQSVDLIREEDTVITVLNATQQLIDAGEQVPGTKIEKTFTIVNNGDKPITIEEIRIACDCMSASTEVKELQPDEQGDVQVTFDTKGYTGHQVKSVYIKYSGAKEELRLVITTELK